MLKTRIGGHQFVGCTCNATTRIEIAMIARHGLKLLITGLAAACGLVVEIAAGRLIAPYLGMSLYTWTAIISVVLAGFSVGHWIGGRIAEGAAAVALRRVAYSLVLAGLSTLATLVLLRVAAPTIISWQAGAVITTLAVATVLFFLPSVFVGVPSPVLTKIAVDEDPPGEIGRTIGAFYAIGAVGSIVGTLAAGYVFISWLGTTATLLVVAVTYLVLAAMAFWLERQQPAHAGIAVTVVACLIGLALIGGVGARVKAFHDPCRVASNYYCIRVVDVSQQFDQPARAMILDHLGHGINLRDDPQKLVSPYVELQDSLARIHSGRRTPFKAFFIGGGAYTLPRAWAAARPDAQIIVAEIDPAVTGTARRTLWLRPSNKITSIHADARVALTEQPAGAFDVVVGDAFHDIVIPAHLVTDEFFRLVAARLGDDGIYLMNVVDDRDRPRLVLSIAKALAVHFKVVEIWRADQSGRRATFVLAGLQAATPYKRIAARNTPGTTFSRVEEKARAAWAKALRPVLLRDDFAPVDRLIGVE